MAKAIMAFREGDRSEYLAQSVFSTIGFVATVSRQEDRFLTDLFVQLNVEGNSAMPGVVEPTGLCIAVQVKSNFEPIVATRDPSAAALVAAFGCLPWFIAVAEKKSGAVSVYSTVRRHFWRNVSGFSIALESPPRAKAKGSPGTVYVGPPVVRAQIRDLDSPAAVRRSAARQRFRQTILSWASLDATNIAYRSLGIPAIVLPRTGWRGGILRDEDIQLHFLSTKSIRNTSHEAWRSQSRRRAFVCKESDLTERQRAHEPSRSARCKNCARCCCRYPPILNC